MILQKMIWKFSIYSKYLIFIFCRGVPFFIINDKYYLEGANPPAAFVSVFHMIEKTDGVNSKEA